MIDQMKVARNEEQAKLNSGVYSYLDENDLDLDDVTVFCKTVGPVRVVDDR